MVKNLFLEIGTEELPSSSINEAKVNLKVLLEDSLASNRLLYEDVSVFATPRRIVAFIANLEEKQQPSEKIITGPPVRIAFDIEGNPTQSAKGFAKSVNLTVEQLAQIDNGKGLYLGYKTVEEGRSTAEILPDILKNAVLSMTFSKQMTWGNYSLKFSRPVRWIAALFGADTVKFKIENIESSDSTFGLRNLEEPEIKIHEFKSIKHCLDFFESGAQIILDPEKRKQQILGEIEKLEKEKWSGKFKVVIDGELLAEVVNLIEIPNVLTGTFPEEYLYIPKEILIRAIQHHQRYFAVVDKKGNVSAIFITIQNGTEDPKGEIIKGNERVLKARLSDAKFFYEQDRKCSFDFWVEKLKGVVFYSGLGSLFDKS
ncbi:MAG: glycine--tRNA ligase subunit beta, partial [Actinobacteria bacterium]|nr:glycine--tRNA ligase subunit beta [Actinomycetota bacterium]